MSSEARRHSRIETALPCRVATERGADEGRILNLGLGGALVRAASGLAEVGEAFSLELDRTGKEQPLLLLAEVVRVRDEGPNADYGLRFQPGPPSLQEELSQFVSSLAGFRANAGAVRVHRRLDVHCDGPSQFQATLQNIWAGGLTLESELGAAEGDPIKVRLQLPSLPTPVELSGTVAAVSEAPGQGRQLSVRFEPLPTAERGRLEELIRLLLLLGGRR